MPIYEYQCISCDIKTEFIQKVDAPRITTCPKCGQDTLEKVTSMSAFHLKGGGWYKDGYNSSSKNSKDSTVKKAESSKPTEAKSKDSNTTVKSKKASSSENVS